MPTEIASKLLQLHSILDLQWQIMSPTRGLCTGILRQTCLLLNHLNLLSRTEGTLHA